MKLEIISREPAADVRPTPLLFIHGMFHGAWCWDVHFLEFFASRGYSSHAVDLRGHGKSDGRARLRWTRIADYVDDVACAVEQMSSPPVLIGHSLGGFVVQKYLETRDARGGVLLSSPPPSGLIQAALAVARRHPIAFAKINLTLSLAPVIATPALAREAFFSNDLPELELQGYWRRLQDESYMAFLDMVALDLPKPARVKAPVLVIGAARDNMLSRSAMEATARAYNTRAHMIPDVAHDSMLELQWKKVAEHMLGWFQEQAL